MGDKKIEILNKSIDKRGLLKTIQALGGFDNFNVLYSNYFDNKEKKIELINDICENQSSKRIHLYEINYEEIKIDERFDEDSQHSFDSYVTIIEPNYAYIEEWEFNDEGEMFDEYYDRYTIPTSKLPKSVINYIFELLVAHYLNN